MLSGWTNIFKCLTKISRVLPMIRFVPNYSISFVANIFWAVAKYSLFSGRLHNPVLLVPEFRSKRDLLLKRTRLIWGPASAFQRWINIFLVYLSCYFKTGICNGGPALSLACGQQRLYQLDLLYTWWAENLDLRTMSIP